MGMISNCQIPVNIWHQKKMVIVGGQYQGNYRLSEISWSYPGGDQQLSDTNEHLAPDEPLTGNMVFVGGRYF